MGETDESGTVDLTPPLTREEWRILTVAALGMCGIVPYILPSEAIVRFLATILATLRVSSVMEEIEADYDVQGVGKFPGNETIDMTMKRVCVQNVVNLHSAGLISQEERDCVAPELFKNHD